MKSRIVKIQLLDFDLKRTINWLKMFSGTKEIRRILKDLERQGKNQLIRYELIKKKNKKERKNLIKKKRLTMTQNPTVYMDETVKING